MHMWPRPQIDEVHFNITEKFKMVMLKCTKVKITFEIFARIDIIKLSEPMN